MENEKYASNREGKFEAKYYAKCRLKCQHPASGIPDEGPAASIPFSEIGPSSHTQEITEPTNFEKMDEQTNAPSRQQERMLGDLQGLQHIEACCITTFGSQPKP